MQVFRFYICCIFLVFWDGFDKQFCLILNTPSYLRLNVNFVLYDMVGCILSFTSPIYDVLRRTDMEASSLHLVYEMWDSMIEKVKNVIYQYERKEESEGSTFYEVVHSILIDR